MSRKSELAARNAVLEKRLSFVSWVLRDAADKMERTCDDLIRSYERVPVNVAEYVSKIRQAVGELQSARKNLNNN